MESARAALCARLRRCVLARKVNAEYDKLEDEFAFLDQILKARALAGLTQSEIARRIGTTQSAVAWLDSGSGKHSPSVATLRTYAKALGFRLELRVVEESPTSGTQRLGM